MSHQSTDIYSGLKADTKNLSKLLATIISKDSVIACVSLRLSQNSSET